MTNETETALLRLIELIDQQGSSGMDIFKEESEQARIEQARRISDSTYYYAGLVGETLVRDRQDNVVAVERVVDTFPLLYEEIPAFCVKNGLRTDELIDVLELRRKEVSAKGKTWRAGKGTYIDRSTLEADREKATSEAAKHQQRVDARNEAILHYPQSLPMHPTMKNWRTD